MQSPEPVRIGVYRDINSAYWGYFQGRIDEVRVWNYALSATEVLARYNTTLVGNETGLVAYYPMDITGSGAGTLVPNQATLTGSAINGTTVGTTSSPVFSPNSQPLVPVNLGNDTSLCPGQQISLNASLSGATYLWQNNSTLPTFQVTQPGNYWVQVSLGGCASTDTLVVLQEVLPVDLGPDTGLCPGDILTLNATLPGATYLWDNGATGPVRTITQPGTYWVSVSRNGCTGYDSISVDFITLPAIDLGQDTSICEGTLFSLSAGSIPLTVSLLWSTGATSHTIYPGISGSYWLKASVGSCEESDTINVYFKPLPQTDLGPDTILCEGDQIVLDASWPGGLYLWNDGSTNPTLNIGLAGTYSVTVTADGCINQDAIAIDTDSVPEVYLGDDTTICEGDEILLTAGNGFTAYLWNTGVTGNVIEIGQQGAYWVNVTNICGEAADTFQLSTKDCEYTIYIPNTFTPWRVDGINDKFEVKGTGIAEYYIIIFNRWGGQLYESHSLYEPWDGTYHGKRCPQSVYYYRIDFRPERTNRWYTRQGSITLL